MEEKDVNIYIELAESKTKISALENSLNEVKEEIKDMRNDQKAIYEISTSVKLIAQSMNTMKDDLIEVKKGQIELSGKVDAQITEVKVGQKNLEKQLHEKVDCISKEMEVSEKRHFVGFDIRDLLTKNWYKIAIGLAGLVTMIAQYPDIVKFFQN